MRLLFVLPEANAAAREILSGKGEWAWLIRNAWQRQITDDAEVPCLDKKSVREAACSKLRLEAGRLCIRLAGRVDAISAPELLESYEMAAGRGGFKEVCVAADEAMYMSSSGQRVLRMILQDCRVKKIPVQCDSALLSDRG